MNKSPKNPKVLNRNIYQKFLKTYLTYPKKDAVIDSINIINYEDLFFSAYKLSREIIKETGFNKNIPIVISAEKKIESIISIYAVIMSGNVYCPIDFASNFSRAKNIIDDLKPGLLIVSNEYDEIDDCKIIFPKILKHKKISDTKMQDLICDSNKIIDLDPIYIIFTSGSTGKPKGVTNSHAGVVDYIDWAQKTFLFCENDVFGNQAPLVFDNSTLDIFATMNVGASMLLIDQSILRFPAKTIELLNSYQVSVIFWVPSQYLLFEKTKAFDSGLKLKSLKWGLFAGEVMQTNTLKYWIRFHTHTNFANLYGPTEITVDCTYYIVPDDFNDDEVPIGYACDNSELLIINEHGSPSDQGELYVRGIGNALGYWNDKFKTNESFVQNPLHENFIDICYKTGDQVKTVNGKIYFIGRNDNQIKFQGYRIELGEIERNVIEIENISTAIIGFDKEKQLIWLAYKGDIEKQDLLESIKKKLPSYMIPKKIKSIDNIPYLDSGKIDRKNIAELMNDY